MNQNWENFKFINLTTLDVPTLLKDSIIEHDLLAAIAIARTEDSNKLHDIRELLLGVKKYIADNLLYTGDYNRN